MTNMHTVAALMFDDVTTISCHFVNDAGTQCSQHYTFLVTKELAAILQEGDYVMVRVSNARIVKMVCVDEIHEETRLDMSASWRYNWAFQKVNLGKLEELEDRHEEVAVKLERKRAKQAKLQALASLGLNDLGDTMLISHKE